MQKNLQEAVRRFSHAEGGIGMAGHQLELRPVDGEVTDEKEQDAYNMF